MTDTDNAAQVIRDLSYESSKPRELEPGVIYAWLDAGQVHQVDLTGDEYLDLPRRKRGTVSVRDVASFAQYHGKHAGEHSEVFADLDAATITAVLNAHAADGADWQDHRVTLTMVKTPQWITWTSHDSGSDSGRLMTQDRFAEFIEDNAADVAPGGPCTAADLLEVAQKFQAHTKVTFSSGKRLQSGETQFVYSEQIDGKAGDRGTIEIPNDFELAIAPFEDCEPYRVQARFRYRINSGDLRMGYHLNDPSRIFRDAVLQVVTKAEKECGDIKIMRGKPA
jgi:uncharacterized protein YfdQ (DUF2303 family)